MSALIIDIDGVVCDSSARLSRYSDHQALERGDYNAFRVSMNAYNRAPVDEDIPIEHGVKLFNSLRDFYSPEKIIFLTARGPESRVNTLNWLRRFVYFEVTNENLIMRPEYRETESGVLWREGEPHFCPIEYKRLEVLKLLDEREVVMAIDDHLPICEMYQKLGVPALHVKWPGVDCISKSGMDYASQKAAK
jgi:hypothetical protein